MAPSEARLEALRDQLARMERGGGGAAFLPLPLAPAIDRHLPGGGLARGALHEIQMADRNAGFAFAALILGRTTGPVLWIAPAADTPWAPGLHCLGLPPERLLLAGYRQPADGLWLLEEALRTPGLGGAVLRLDVLDLTASRRLQLAVEGSPRIGLLLRAAAEHGPSSATSRWRVASHPDPALRPCWRLALLRCRGGQPAAWLVCHEGGALQVEALP
ncbi:ImuA family protein [Teichococcus aestuarii]|uniref:ImuA family protein n=1 Tax=Teichococcus aestuarii TaxID=568898 RepID=UPI0036217B00